MYLFFTFPVKFQSSQEGEVEAQNLIIWYNENYAYLYI